MKQKTYRWFLALVMTVGAAFSATAQTLYYRLDGLATDLTLGSAIAAVGDLDGDGVSDLSVGAPLAHGEQDFINGRVYVYSGATGMLIRTLEPLTPRGQLGWSLSALGDIDGDGVPDHLVGSPYSTTEFLFGVGSALVYSGATGDVLYNFLGEDGGSYTGYSVSGLGDVNGDGVPDLIAGIPYGTGQGGPGVGNAIVRSGADGQVLYRFEGALPGEFLGWAVTGLGDVDGDFVPDLALGAPDASPDGRPQAGRVEVRSGATGALIYALSGPVDAGYFGKALAALEDLDGDGAPELIVGAPGNNSDGAVSAGSVWVFSGATGALIYRWNGADAFDELGAAVAGGGDVDGDGIPDLVAGAPGASPDGRVGAGRAYVFSGLTGQVIARWDGESAGDTLGRAVAVISDLNGDGRHEVAIGAPYVSFKDRAAAGQVSVYSFMK